MGDRLLAGGPPSRTFNMEDLERLTLSGAPLGLGACRVADYLGRDLDSPVWNEETDCDAGSPLESSAIASGSQRARPRANARSRAD